MYLELYSRVTAINKKKKKSNQLYPDQTPLYVTSDQDVHGLGFIYRIWHRQTVLIKTKKKRKKMGAFKRCILLSLSVKRPLIFWTRRLHLDVLQSQCIHTCHTNGLIIRLLLLMIRVNRLFTAQRSVKC